MKTVVLSNVRNVVKKIEVFLNCLLARVKKNLPNYTHSNRSPYTSGNRRCVVHFQIDTLDIDLQILACVRI